MSKEILIVGSGFMGTSMALALENDNVTCFETHEAYLATLNNLNIYKNIFFHLSTTYKMHYFYLIVIFQI